MSIFRTIASSWFPRARVSADGDAPSSTDVDPYFGDWWWVNVAARNGVVSPEQALRLSTIYACVRLLSETLAQTPLVLYRREIRNGRAIRTIEYQHPLSRLTRLRPNRIQTPFAYAALQQGHAVLRGRSFATVRFDPLTGYANELVPLHPDRVVVRTMPGREPEYVFNKDDGTQTTYAINDLLTVFDYTTDGVDGKSSLAASPAIVAAGLSVQDYAQRFFDNDGRPGGWIEHPSKFKTTEEFNKFRNQWREAQQGGNRGRVAVLQWGMKYHDNQALDNDNAQMIETRQAIRGEIASLYRVPPHMIGDLSRATNNNIEQMSLEFLRYTMGPWYCKWAQEFTAKLVPEDEQDEYFFDFDTTRLALGDLNSVGTFVQRMTQGGVMVRNEGRAMIGLNPIEGLDTPLSQVNMTTSAKIEDDSEDDSEDAPVSARPGQPTQPAQTASFERMRIATHARIAARVRAYRVKDISFADAKFATFLVQCGARHNTASRIADTIENMRDASVVDDLVLLACSLFDADI
jgi:HK97 family phage portal protein